MADYKKSSFISTPRTLDQNEYYNLSQELRRAEEERTAIRANLKRQFLVMLNNPHTKEPIEDPAVTRWVYARSANIYPNFRPTLKTSFIGFMFGIVPLFTFYFIFKTNRDKREAKIKAGNDERKFNMSY